MSIKLIKFEKGNKQLTYYPEKKEQTFQIPLQKKIEVESGKKIEVKSKDEIIIDKIVQRNDEFGQPYLPIKLIAEVINNGKNPKIHGMKYKAKKRTKKTWGHQEQYTLIRILKLVESK
jgi:ribosomal protein L21